MLYDWSGRQHVLNIERTCQENRRSRWRERAPDTQEDQSWEGQHMHHAESDNQYGRTTPDSIEERGFRLQQAMEEYSRTFGDASISYSYPTLDGYQFSMTDTPVTVEQAILFGQHPFQTSQTGLYTHNQGGRHD
jgi:hypothetical protein